jgi:hypothetical protein
MNKIYFDKTEKGRVEITNRTYQLSAKFRPLLVIVDGKHTLEELLKSVQGLGLSQVHLDSLESEGFIVRRTESSEAKAATEDVEIKATVAQPTVVANPIALTPEQSAARLMAIRTFFNDTVKSNLGLRGFGMQLKVERAETLDDFLQLREPYLEAVEKAKGAELAKTLASKLDQLFSGKLS